MPSMVGVMADSYNKPAAGGGDPFTMVAWHAAYWASDPGWTPPANGATVTSWRDGSGNARTMSSAGGLQPPTFRTTVAGLNNKPGVEYDGTDDRLHSATFTAINPPYAMVAVFRPTVDGVDRYTLTSSNMSGGAGVGINASSNWHLFAGADLVGTAVTAASHFLNTTVNGASSTIRVDGVQVAAGNSGTPPAADRWMIATYANGSAAYGKSTYGFVGFKIGALTGPEETGLLAWARSFYGTP